MKHPLIPLVASLGFVLLVSCNQAVDFATTELQNDQFSVSLQHGDVNNTLPPQADPQDPANPPHEEIGAPKPPVAEDDDSCSRGPVASNPVPTNASVELLTGEEMRACQKAAGNLRPWKVAARMGRDIFLKGQNIAIKVAGSLNKAKVRIVGEGDPGAICIIVVGNRNGVLVDVAANVEQIHYFGAGNQSEGLIALGDGVHVGNFQARVSGNQAKLEVTGPVGHDCPSVQKAGAAAGVLCH